MAIPLGNHIDWPFPFKYIPRSWTAFEGAPPKKVAGNTDDLKPIPDPGHWIITSPPYFAFQTKGGWHFRFGIRWDNVDGYYNFPSFTIKKYY